MGGPGRGKRGTVVTESFLRNTEGALKPENVSTNQERIAKLARSNESFLPDESRMV